MQPKMVEVPLTPSYHQYSQSHSAEEYEGLLHNDDEHFDKEERYDGDDNERGGWPRAKIVKVASALIVLLVLGAFARHILRGPPPKAHPNLSFNGDLVRSNGTHDFKRTVLIVSIDGLRCVAFCFFCPRKFNVVILARTTWIEA